jgi:hypothetical protein
LASKGLGIRLLLALVGFFAIPADSEQRACAVSLYTFVFDMAGIIKFDPKRLWF